MAKKSYGLVDDEDDVRDKRADVDMDFDELPNAIQFPDADESNESADEDEDLADDEDGARTPNADDDQDTDEEEEEERPAPRDSVAKRVARERRLREEAEGDADAYRHNNEVLTKRLEALERSFAVKSGDEEFGKRKDELTGKLSTLRTKQATAIEAGDTAAQVQLNEELADAVADLKMLQRDRERAAEAVKAAGDSTTVVPPNRHLARWMRQHGDNYRTDEAFRLVAQSFDRQVHADGFDKNTEEYFDELNRRLAKRFPDKVKIHRKERTPERSRHPASPAPSERSTGARRAADSLDIKVVGNKAQLSPQHLKIMRAFGMDPDSASDRKTFVKENATRRGR